MTFVELSWFNQRVHDFLTDDEFRKLQSTLLDDPNIAPVMPGCGGLRKLRWKVTDSGKGKRGGCRVIYLNHPRVARIDLVAIYGKGEQESLTATQKRELKTLTETLKREVLVAEKKRNRK